MRVAFEKFHEENPKVYRLFKRFAFAAINTGHEHLSSEMVINRIRWETSVETRDEEYKINNNHKPFYARLFETDFPHHEGFFRKRTSAADE